MLPRRRGAPALVLAATLLSPCLAPAHSGPAPSRIDRAAPPATDVATTERAAVLAAYDEVYVPAVSTPVGWTGSVADCRPGAPSEAASRAGLDLVNYLRDQVGLPAVHLDPALSRRAQAAALILEATGEAQHGYEPSTRCWTEDGDAASEASILYAGLEGSDVYAGLNLIPLYMDDYAEPTVGHRRAILMPTAAGIGLGQTTTANALTIPHLQASPDVPTYLPWPPAGNVPADLVPEGLWSLGSSDPRVDFDRATVRMTGPDGDPVRTSQNPAGVTDWFDYPGLTWSVGGRDLPTFPGAEDVTFRVVVSGAERGRRVLPPIVWDTTLVSRALAPTGTAPTILGSGTAADPYRLSRTPTFDGPVEELEWEWYLGEELVGDEPTLVVEDWMEGGAPHVEVWARSGFWHRPGLLEAGATFYPMTQERAPRIRGVAEAFRTLSIDSGEVLPPPTSSEVQWFRDGVPIPGASGPSLTLTGQDVGRTISATTTGHRAGQSPLVGTTAGVLVRAASFEAGSTPYLAGTVAAVGQRLYAAGLEVWPVPDQRAVQWLRDGDPIPGATGTTYRMTRKDRRRVLSFRVTDQHDGYADLVRTSDDVRVR